MRRIWMLLFVLVLTVVVMAVPALAADHDHGTCNYANNGCNECCNGFDHEAAGWTDLNANYNKDSATGTALTAGKYYLSDDLTESFNVSSGNVVICLNGKELTATDGRRAFTVTGGTLTIVDCSKQEGSYVSKGVIRGAKLDTASGNGGTIFINAGEIYIYNGTITGGTAKTGGNVTVQAASGKTPKFYFWGGQVLGGGQSNFSSYDTSTKKLTLTSHEQGGVAGTTGGNVFVSSNGNFEMGNPDFTYPSDNSAPAIVGGVALATYGGNVYVQTSYGHFYLNAGVIRDGLGPNHGGNVAVTSNGNFHISGGLVTGGLIRGKTVPESSANFYLEGAKVDMSAGKIEGYFFVNGAACTIDLSGTAKIVSKSNGVATGGLQFYTGTSAINTVNVGTFASGAEIYVQTQKDYMTSTSTTSTLLVKPEIDATAMADVNGDNTVDWKDYEDATRYVHGIPGNCGISYEEDGIYLRSVVQGEIYHCLCCGDQPAFYANGIKHVGDCDGYDVAWMPLNMSSGDKLPAAGGHFYLVEADGSDGGIRGATTQSEYNAAVDLYIDLNGLTFTSGRRILKVNGTDANVTFTNSKGNGGFKLVNSLTVFNNMNWDAFEVSNVTGAHSLSFYRLTVDGSEYKSNGGFLNVLGGECKLYNVTVKGAKVTDAASTPYGGALTVGANGTLTMDGCTLTGGNAPTCGGVIYAAGKLTLNNCTISQGTAEKGGNLYAKQGSDVTINGGTISGNVRTEVYAKLTLTGAVKINDGTKENTAGIYLPVQTKLDVSGVTGNADIVLYVANPDDSNTLSEVAENGLNLDGFNLINKGHYLNDVDGALSLANSTEGAAALRNRVLYSASEAALAGAKNGDFVKLFAGAENATVNANITLDLNGQTVTNLGVAADKKISLFDSTGSSYGAPTGSVTLASGTTTASFNREMLTGGVTDKNMRYVTVAVTENEVTTLTAHRIYLSIKSVSLVAREDPGLGFRTVLRCDEDLAKLLVYGAAVRFVNSDKVACSIYTNIDAWDSENQTENSKLSGLLFDIENSQLTDNVSTKLVANAYLIINDDFADYDEVTDETGAKIAIQNGQSNALLSSTSMSVSLQDAVEATDVMYDDLADNLINGLTKMINKWQAVMNGWNIPNIKKLIDVTE